MVNPFNPLIMVLKRLVSWILSTSIFAAFCALALTLGVERLLLARSGVRLVGYDFDVRAWNHPLHLLVFGATLLEYNAHFLLNAKQKGPYVTGAWVLALTGSILCVMALPGMPVSVFVLFGCLGLLAVLYSAPYIPFRPKRRINDYGITKILVLTCTWVAMTTILPALYLGFAWNASGVELLVRVLLIFPLCLAFDLRDYEADKRKGIQTIAGALGERNSYRLIYITLLILSLFACVLRFMMLLSFWHFAAILIAAFAAFLAVRFARKTRHPFIYPGLIDGVMLLYGLLIWLLA